jgi:KDO2-lipid IV(A) lauroyltransferase
MRSLLRILHQGETVGILLDQKVSWTLGVYVKFFDQPTFANKGMALMALKTGTAVVPVFMIRKNDYTYEIIIEPELELIRTGDKTKDLEENTALFTKVIERYVSKYPGQWLWMHNRWKRRPHEAWPRQYNPR